MSGHNFIVEGVCVNSLVRSEGDLFSQEIKETRPYVTLLQENISNLFVRYVFFLFWPFNSLF